MVEPTTLEMQLKNRFSLFPWWLILMWGILALIVGIMFFATPAMTTVLFITFLGVYLLISGLFALASLAVDRTNAGWKIFLGVLDIVAGILILIYPLYSTLFILSLFILFIGFWLCFTGGAHLFHAYGAKDSGTAVLGILSLLFGLLLLVFPLVSVALLPFIAGAFAVVLGISAIVVSFTAKKAQAAQAL